MNFSRTICTERECFLIELDDAVAADTDQVIIVEIETAAYMVDVAYGARVSVSLHIDPETARRFSAVVFGAYIAAEANKPRSELFDGYEVKNGSSSVSIDAWAAEDCIIIDLEEIFDAPARCGLNALHWSSKLPRNSAVELAEALLSAAKVAGGRLAIGA